jgi:hypothetical protein
MLLSQTNDRSWRAIVATPTELCWCMHAATSRGVASIQINTVYPKCSRCSCATIYTYFHASAIVSIYNVQSHVRTQCIIA